MVSRLVLASLIPAAVLMAAGSQAHAHAALTQASPRVGSTVAASPTEVRMWFSEALEPAFSGAAIVDQSEAKAVVDPNDRKELVIPVVRPLPPGRYQVKWAVVSVDGHRTEGDFRFTVGTGR
jgi:methionine-rich copper-binding protein CopC